MSDPNLDRTANRISDLQMSDEVFSKICEIAKVQAGLQITSKKRALVQSRISKRLRETQISSFENYVQSIMSGNVPDELTNMISALTTNVSSFFREPHHFEELENRLVPEILRKLKDEKRVRIWSAGCSSGQEPYSIAMILHNSIPNIETQDIKILATDIDINILQLAQAGSYDKQFAHEIPKRFECYYEEMSNGNDRFIISQPIKNLVSFRQLNLFSSWPMRFPFDLIFCRNVVIYFDEPTQRSLWPRFRQNLVLGGTFFLGHSERISKPQSIGFEPKGVTQYEAVLG